MSEIKKSTKPKKNKKRRISKRELKRRSELKRKLIRTLLIIAALIALLIIVLQIKKEMETEIETTITEEVSMDELRHLSFDILSIDASESRMSVEEFAQALQELYDAGYVLVDVYDIVELGEDGSFSYKQTITLPEGKIPLLLTQREVSYPFNAQEIGVASSLVLENGEIKAQYTTSDGQILVGDYDIVPILETFIAQYPDFSYNGARAVLGVSGYCGVLGYRTSSYLESSDDNPYAAYGLFDIESERASATEIVNALTELGYHFASYGFADDISYGAEYSIVESDASQWQSEVAEVVGETDILLLPKQTDIDSWKGYSEDDVKYALLSGLGFDFYFVGNNSSPYMLQVSDGYVRQTVYEINTYDDFTAALTAEAG